MSDVEFTERSFTWQTIETERDREFARPYIRFGWLETLPVPDRFSAHDYLNTAEDDRLSFERRSAQSRNRMRTRSAA